MLLIAAAYAHIPHDNVIALAAGEDFATSGAGYAVVAVDGSLDGFGWWPYRSANHGQHWDPMPRPPTVGDVASLAVFEGQPLLGTDSGELWSWDGATWARHSGPAADINGLVAATGVIVVGTDAGAYLAPALSGPWTLLLPAPTAVVDLDRADPSLLLLRERDGALHLGRPDALVELPGAPISAIDAVVDGGVVYAGGVGAVYRWDGASWSACGALPVSDPTLEHADRVSRLLVDGATLFAGTGQYLYSSLDGCATWLENDAFGETAVYDAGAGTADSPASSYVGLAGGGGVVMTAGFRGAVFKPAGRSWHSARVHDSTFVRAMSIAQDAADDPDALHLWATSYGGGLLDVRDGGASFVRAGIPDATEANFGRDVGVRPNGLVVYASDLEAWASTDGGLTLSPTPVLTDSLKGLRTAGGRAWQLGARASRTALAASVDGFTWARVDLPFGYPMDVAGRTVAGVEGVMVRTTGPAGVVFSPDSGATWTTVYEGVAEISGVVTWPPGEGGRIVRSGDDGVWLSDDQGGSWTAARVSPELPPRNLKVSASSGILGFDLSGQMWQSVDGGETWAPRGVPVPGPQDWLEFRDRVVVATLRGIVWSDDLGATWRTAPYLDHIESLDEGMVCEDPSGAEFDCRDLLANGALVRVSSRATRFRVEADAPMDFEVSVRGEALGTVAAGAWFDLPASGWTDVALTVVNGIGHVVLFEGWIPGEPIVIPEDPVDTGDTGGADTGDTADTDRGDTADTADTADSTRPPGPDGGCGCGGGSPAAAALLVLLARRRPAPR